MTINININKSRAWAFTVSKHFAAYFVTGDASFLTDEELEICKELENDATKDGFIFSHVEGAENFTRCAISRKMADCVDIHFIPTFPYWDEVAMEWEKRKNDYLYSVIAVLAEDEADPRYTSEGTCYIRTEFGYTFIFRIEGSRIGSPCQYDCKLALFGYALETQSIPKEEWIEFFETLA